MPSNPTFTLNGVDLTTAQLLAEYPGGEAIVLSGGTLVQNAGAKLTIGAGSRLGALQLIHATLSGGTIIDNGDGLAATGGINAGILDGVTYQGTLDLSANNSTITVTDGITFLNLAGNGPGLVKLTGAYSNLFIDGDSVLNNATIDIGNATSADLLWAVEDNGPAVLTLGRYLSLTQTGTFGGLQDGGASGDGIVNDGVITAITRGFFHVGSYQAIKGDNFTNNGTIGVGGGDLFWVDDSSFTNTGYIAISTAGTLVLNDATIDNSGTIQMDSTGVLQIGATGSNDAITLDGGSIVGGVVKDTGGVLGSGALAGVTYDGVLAMGPSGGVLKITGGLTLKNQTGTGNGLLIMTGAGNTLDILGTTTLNNATIDIGNSSPAGQPDALNGQDNGGAPAVLTFGAGLTIDVTGVYAAITTGTASGDRLINNGVINSGLTPGDELSVSTPNFTNNGTINISNDADDFIVVGQNTNNVYLNPGKFTNNKGAVINVGAGSRLSIEGSNNIKNYGTINFGNLSSLFLSGDSLTTAQLLALDHGNVEVYLGVDTVLDNAGATLQVGAGTVLGDITPYAATIVGGVIADSDSGGGIAFSEFSLATFDHVVYRGTLNLGAASSGYADLVVNGGITLENAAGTGPGTVNLLDFNDDLTLDGTTTLNNATINIGNPIGGNPDYANKVLSRENGGAAVLTLGKNLHLDQTSGDAVLQDGGGAGDGIVNDGSIAASAGNVPGPYSPYDNSMTISGNSFTNNGVLAVSNGDYLFIITSQLGNLSDGVLTGGGWSVSVASTLDLETGAPVTALGASLTLSGPDAVWETGSVALDQSLTLVEQTGALNLLAGQNFTTAAAFTDEGKISLGGGDFDAGSLLVAAGGSFAGYGGVAGPVTDQGSITAQGDLALAGAIAGNGKMLIDAAATLSLAGAVAAGIGLDFAGPGALDLSDPTAMGGLIEEFVAGDSIDLLGASFTGFAFSGHDLDIGLAGGGSVSLAFQGSYNTASFDLANTGGNVVITHS